MRAPASDRRSTGCPLRLPNGIGKSKPPSRSCGRTPANAPSVNRRREACLAGPDVCRSRPSRRRAGGIRRGQPAGAHACGRARASWPGAAASTEPPRKRSRRFGARGRWTPATPSPRTTCSMRRAISGNASAAQEASEALAAAYPKLLQAKPQKTATPVHPSRTASRCRCRPAHSSARRVQPGVPRPGTRPVRTRDCRIPKGRGRRPAHRRPGGRSGLMARAFGALRQGRVTDARSLLEAVRPTAGFIRGASCARPRLLGGIGLRQEHRVADDRHQPLSA